MKKLDEILKENQLNPNIYMLIKLSGNWEKVMGEFIGKNSIPIRLNKDQLTIAVADNIWMNEFSLMKQEFLDRLKKYGYTFINDIRFVVRFIVKKISPAPFESEITEDMRKTASEYSQPIKDEVLRSKFEKAFLKYLAANRSDFS
jgi:predicted nucleic acid-binding Zn ribbon protein